MVHAGDGWYKCEICDFTLLAGRHKCFGHISRTHRRRQGASQRSWHSPRALWQNIMANDGHHESWKFLLHIQILSILLTLRSPEDRAGGICRENDDFLEGNDEGGEE